jgi:hypothetical protein
MRITSISLVSCAALLALIPVAIAGPTRSLISGIISPQVQVERIYHHCRGRYVWIPDGTIAGLAGGYPYFGWYGYPYVPYRCVRLRRSYYNYYR